MYAIFHKIITFIFHALYHSMLSKKKDSIFMNKRLVLWKFVQAMSTIFIF